MTNLENVPDITDCCKFMFFFDGSVVDLAEVEVEFISLEPEVEFVATRLSQNVKTQQYRLSVWVRSEMNEQRLLNVVTDAFLQLVPHPDFWNVQVISKEDQAANVKRIKDAILDAADKFA
jgi:hypothetical protein